MVGIYSDLVDFGRVRGSLNRAGKIIGGHEFVRIPETTFVMGSDKFEDATPHWVSHSPFWIGKTRVTAEQYRSRIKGGYSSKTIEDLPANHSVAYLRWYDVHLYLAQLRKEADSPIRLPTVSARSGGYRLSQVDKVRRLRCKVIFRQLVRQQPHGDQQPAQQGEHYSDHQKGAPLGGSRLNAIRRQDSCERHAG